MNWLTSTDDTDPLYDDLGIEYIPVVIVAAIGFALYVIHLIAKG